MNQMPPEFVIDETPQPTLTTVQVSQVRDQIVGLIKSLAELTDKLAQTEQQTKGNKRRFLMALLEVADAFDRIFHDLDLTQLNEIAQNVVGSFKTTSILLEDVLDQEEVFPMDDLEGQTFDPHTQRGVGVEQQPGIQDGIVLEVRERGYWWQDQVLRKAKVIISAHS